MSDHKIKGRDLVLSAVLTAVIFLLPYMFSNSQILLCFLQVILSLSVLFINRRIFINGSAPFFRRSPNIDTLISLGTLAAFFYSAFVNIRNIIFYSNEGEYTGESELYFGSFALILTFALAGKFLEALAGEKTAGAIKSLSDMSPVTALKIINGQEQEVPVESIKSGDIFVVKPGMSIPVDGVVESGTSAVNESSLTGESMPVDKGPGMTVSASTINLSGFLTCRAVNVGSDTAFSKIVKMVTESSSGKTALAGTADRICSVFIPAVIAASVITFLYWYFSEAGMAFSVSRAVSVLIVSCPAALLLAAPIAITVGNSVGKKSGIIYKTAHALENAGRTQIVVMDKTGTLTTGSPKVTDIISTKNDIEHRDLLLSIAYALESMSEHPLAKAICDFAKKRFIPLMKAENFEAFPGKGIKADLVLGGKKHTVYAGNESFIEESLLGEGRSGEDGFDNDFSSVTKKLIAEGKTPTLFASDSGMLGVIASSDELKDGSITAVNALHNEDIHVCMVTGDRLATSEAVGEMLGIDNDDVISEVRPDEKAVIVKKLRETGKVAMIGDGINDAPALLASDTGIAIGAGTDIAMDAADVILVNDSLLSAVDAIRLSKETLGIIHQNLFWAFVYNIIGIPLAAGCFYTAFGWVLDPTFCAAAMSISGLFVITNSMRLFSFKKTEPVNEEEEDQTEELS